MFKDTNNSVQDKQLRKETSAPPTGAVTEIFRSNFSAVIVTPSACNLNVRQNHSISSPVVDTVKCGDVIDVESNVDDVWAKVRTSKGVVGYCMHKYLNRRLT